MTNTSSEASTERGRHHPSAGHGAGPAAPPDADPRSVWEGRYAESDRIWSGRVNTALASVAAGLQPGHALDLGCGEGGDSVWLAEQGWRVIGVDLSTTALARATAAARERGFAEVIDFRQ